MAMLCLLLIFGTGIFAADTTVGVPQTGWKPRNDRGAKTASAWRERYGATTSRQPLPSKRSWQEELQQKVLSDPFGDGSGNGAKKIEQIQAREPQTQAREPQESTQSPTGQVSDPIFRLITTETWQGANDTGATLELIDSQETGAAPAENNLPVKKPMQGITLIQLNRSPAPTNLVDAAPAENDLEVTQPTQEAAADLAVVQQISSSTPEAPDEETERAAIEEAPEIVIPTQNLIEVEQIASLASNEASDEAAVTTAEHEADSENEADTATAPQDFSILQLETTVASTEPGDATEEAVEKDDYEKDDYEKDDYETVSNHSILAEKIPEAIAETTVEKNTANGAELAAYGDTILAQTNNPPTATNAADRPQETDYEKDCRLSREYLLDRKLSDISLHIAVHGKPGQDFPVSCDLETRPLPLHHYRLGEQDLLNFTWTASGLCHKPLYFEEVQAERYGHTIGLLNQPFLSTAHFFCNAAVLPYKIGMRPPQECVYPLGRYRIGGYTPRYIPAVPISIRGGLLQAGGVLAAVFVLP